MLRKFPRLALQGVSCKHQRYDHRYGFVIDPYTPCRTKRPA